MTDWDTIKNNIAEFNGTNKLSPIDNKPLDNELIMCLFCNKINLKYRFEPYYEVPFIEYTTRIFDTILGSDYIDNETKPEPDTEPDTEPENFFDIAIKDKQINIYINSIKNVILTQIRIMSKDHPNILKDNNIDTILNNFDINLILISALENLDMRKYKILSKMLYNKDNLGNKYLDYAKESIINSNKNISLDKMVYGIDLPENFYNNVNYNNLYINIFLIIIIIIIIIINYLRT
jgi:hypothetical protein